MPARRARPARTPTKPPAEPSRLLGRLRELEERVVALEARLTLQAEPGISARAGSGRLAQKRRRCPGCLLELPKGRRGPSCVWCGFYFEAVKAQAAE